MYQALICKWSWWNLPLGSSLGIWCEEFLCHGVCIRRCDIWITGYVQKSYSSVKRWLSMPSYILSTLLFVIYSCFQRLCLPWFRFFSCVSIDGGCVCQVFLESSQNLSINSIVPSEMLIYALATFIAKLYFAISVAYFGSKVVFCLDMICYALPNFWFLTDECLLH